MQDLMSIGFFEQAALSPGHKTADELRKDALAEKWMEGLLADDKVLPKSQS